MKNIRKNECGSFHSGYVAPSRKCRRKSWTRIGDAFNGLFYLEANEMQPTSFFFFCKAVSFAWILDRDRKNASRNRERKRERKRERGMCVHVCARAGVCIYKTKYIEHIKK